MLEPRTSAERVRRRRDKLRASGLRPIQLWAIDTRTPDFAEQCARQAALIRESESLQEHPQDEAWREVADVSGWTA